MEYNNFGKNKLFSQFDNRHEKGEALEIHHFKSEFYVQYRHIQAIILPSPYHLIFIIGHLISIHHSNTFNLPNFNFDH